MDRVSVLLQRARAATSLDDFGEEGFLDGLRILLTSINAQAALNERGRAMAEAQIVDLLSKRLEIEHWYKLHPEIAAQEITTPLIGLGLPRTGSTALACMLAEDPAVRCIRTWEGFTPCPPPETATQYTDPRIAQEEAKLQMLFRAVPKMKTLLPLSATAPLECHQYMAFDFKSQLFQATMKLPDYVHWLNNEADLVPTYQYVKRVMQLLQWRCPPDRWRIKNPGHMLFIGALDQVFPDARYWMTHRDIARVIPSVAGLYCEMGQGFTDRLDREYIVNSNIENWELGVRRLIAFRDAGNAHRFFDIHFAPFQENPLPIIADLYRFLEEDFTQETRARMEAWRRDQPRDKHGRHEADNSGIDLAALREKFQFYTDKFMPASAPM
jgi:hypothetical protein